MFYVISVFRRFYGAIIVLKRLQRECRKRCDFRVFRHSFQSPCVERVYRFFGITVQTFGIFGFLDKIDESHIFPAACPREIIVSVVRNADRSQKRAEEKSDVFEVFFQLILNKSIRFRYQCLIFVCLQIFIQRFFLRFQRRLRFLSAVIGIIFIFLCVLECYGKGFGCHCFITRLYPRLCRFIGRSIPFCGYRFSGL